MIKKSTAGVLDDGKFDDVDPDAYPGLLDVLMALPLVR